MANESLVTKLTISAFKDIACATAIEDPNELILQVNPQEIALKFTVKYGDAVGGGAVQGSLDSGAQGAAGNSFTPQVQDGNQASEKRNILYQNFFSFF